MKSFSLSEPKNIWKNQTNTSTTKNAQPFAKAKRFAQENPQCKQAFYLNKSQLSKRHTSFGFGLKSDFTKTLTCSPPPNQYKSKSEFEINQSKKKGQSFSSNRDASPDRSYLIPQLYKNPGPGNYSPQKKNFPKISYSMHPRTLDFVEDKLSFKNVPGPGSHEQINLSPKSGRFVVSKYPNSRFGTINKSKRFQSQKQTPGPLSYREIDNLSNKGKYVLSKKKGSGTITFDKELRETFFDLLPKTTKNNPPLGNYQLPTDFGTYGDAKYYKTLSNFKSNS